MRIFPFMWLVTLGLLFHSCLHPKEPTAPQLPPETQTGANTFGCYVNGQLWLPEGKPMAGASNFRIDYDPTLSKGFLVINADKINKSQNRNTSINFYQALSSSFCTNRAVIQLKSPKAVLTKGYENTNSHAKRPVWS